MKYYELTYLISSDLTEPEVTDLQEKINVFLQEQGGVLDRAEKPAKKILKSSIKKKGMACLVALNFRLEPEKLADLEKKLKAEPQILRYLILTKKVAKRVKPKMKKRVVPPPKQPIPKKEEKVELKEIEKKLEEILGE